LRQCETPQSIRRRLWNFWNLIFILKISHTVEIQYTLRLIFLPASGLNEWNLHTREFSCHFFAVGTKKLYASSCLFRACQTEWSDFVNIWNWYFVQAEIFINFIYRSKSAHCRMFIVRRLPVVRVSLGAMGKYFSHIRKHFLFD
jgi:hypothetical protein